MGDDAMPTKRGSSQAVGDDSLNPKKKPRMSCLRALKQKLRATKQQNVDPYFIPKSLLNANHNPIRKTMKHSDNNPHTKSFRRDDGDFNAEAFYVGQNVIDDPPILTGAPDAALARDLAKQLQQKFGQLASQTLRVEPDEVDADLGPTVNKRKMKIDRTPIKLTLPQRRVIRTIRKRNLPFTLYMSNLPRGVNKKQIATFIGHKFINGDYPPEIIDISICRFVKKSEPWLSRPEAAKRHQYCPDVHSCYAFCTMSSVELAEEIVKRCNNTVFKERHIYVRMAENKETVSKRSIYLSHLPEVCDEEELRGCFDRFGDIEWIRVIRDGDTSGCLGFGFVTFTSDDAVKACLAEESHFYGNQMISVKKCAKKRKQGKFTQREKQAYNRMKAEQIKKTEHAREKRRAKKKQAMTERATQRADAFKSKQRLKAKISKTSVSKKKPKTSLL